MSETPIDLRLRALPGLFDFGRVEAAKRATFLGVHTALGVVVSHYEGLDLEAIGQGYAPASST